MIQPTCLQEKKLLDKKFPRKMWIATWKTPVSLKEQPQGTPHGEYLKEARLMSRLSHKHVLRVYGVSAKPEPIFIVTEQVTTSLLAFLHKRTTRMLEFHALMCMATEIASGMSYLGDQHCILVSLKAESISLTAERTCKLTDFSLARILPDSEMAPDFANDGKATANKFDKRLPYKWLPPEAAIYNRFSLGSDVWSYGILLYELVTFGRTPYPGLSEGEALAQLKGGARMRPCEGCPEPLYNIMVKCWSEKPGERPTFDFLKTEIEKSFL